MDFQIFIPPVIGGIIGYITNDIAIKMLFHPRKAIYIGKYRVPFTPGLIPKEKDRVSRTIGAWVSDFLLDEKTLKESFTSDETKEKIRAAIFKLIENNRENTATVGELLERIISRDITDRVVLGIADTASKRAVQKFSGEDFLNSINEAVFLKIKEKMSTSKLGFFAAMIDDKIIMSISEGIGKSIVSYISENSDELIENIIQDEADKLMESKICDMIKRIEPKLDTVADVIINAYEKAINKNLKNILESINIKKIVEDKILAFDEKQLEDMIIGMMKKEVRAIINIGAVLGFIIGWINVLLNLV